MLYHHPCHDEIIAHLLKKMPEIPAEFPVLVRPLLSAPFTVKEDLIILSPGDIADLAFWPVEGYIRCFTEFKKEEDRERYDQKTIEISLPGKIWLPVDSYMNRNPVDFYVEISKGTTLVAFSRKSFEELVAAMPEVGLLALAIISAAEHDWLKKLEMCKVNGKTGYETFLGFFGFSVESFIWLMHIANYIGLNRGSLSRIRTVGGFSDEHLRK